MSHGIFTTLFYIPIYNVLIFLINTLPGHSTGVAIIALIVIVRLILFPLSRKAIRTQLLMKKIEPEIQKSREEIKDKQAQAQALMKIYKDNGINPFASFLLMLIQFPVLIGLYQVFRSGLPKIDASVIYSFIHAPTSVSMTFIGINLLNRSIIFAIIAVITQFIQINISLPKVAKKTGAEKRSFQDDLAQSMNTQMRYILPLVVFPIAYISSVVALYLITTNIFTICQELFVRRRMMKKEGLTK